jgi:hypothetical protein
MQRKLKLGVPRGCSPGLEMAGSLYGSRIGPYNRCGKAAGRGARHARGLMAISLRKIRREHNKIGHLAFRLNECQVFLNSPPESVST